MGTSPCPFLFLSLTKYFLTQPTPQKTQSTSQLQVVMGSAAFLVLKKFALSFPARALHFLIGWLCLSLSWVLWDTRWMCLSYSRSSQARSASYIMFPNILPTQDMLRIILWIIVNALSPSVNGIKKSFN